MRAEVGDELTVKGRRQGDEERHGEIIDEAEAAGGQAVAEQVRDSVREKLAACARDWPGRTLAVFACAGTGLLEAIPLPCSLPEQGVLGVRPHIRPLLLALQSEPRARRTAAAIPAMPSGGPSA